MKIATILMIKALKVVENYEKYFFKKVFFYHILSLNKKKIIFFLLKELNISLKLLVKWRQEIQMLPI